MRSLDQVRAKIVTLSDAMKIVKEWKDANETIAFTNGCFDILHKGHITYLAQTADCGSKMILGLNSDQSIKRLKGEDRPINSEDFRAEILAALQFIDLVVVFEEETPIELISTLVPDVLVKGGDYKKEDIVGADVVENNGGKIEIISFVEGYSTTNLINKIRSTP